ncbi:unnamed protein product, partial [Didymodactylos carnosus]
QREQDNHLAQKQRELENDIAVQERLQDKQQQDDSLKENLFSSYLRDITDLTLHNKSININDRMQYIRSKTLTTLRRLDSERKRNLILFLYESNLISYDQKNPQKHVVDLSGADLNNLNFTSTSKLKYWLKSIKLTNVYLINATFINVYLHRADFTNSIMTDSSFSECVLSDSFFKGGILDRADLTNTVMQNTIFYSSSLFQTNFTNAHIDHVDFRNVNLSRSIISNKQLFDTGSDLHNAFLPNGSFGPLLDQKSLISNGDGEKGKCDKSNNTSVNDIPNWSPGSSTFKYRTQVISYDSNTLLRNLTNKQGLCLFSGYKNRTAIVQAIDVVMWSLLIDNEQALFFLSALLGGITNKLDFVKLAAIFYSLSLQEISRIQLSKPNVHKEVVKLLIYFVLESVTNVDRHNQTKLLYRSYNGTLPKGTRHLAIIIDFSKKDISSQNSGICDDIQFLIRKKVT